MKKITDFTESVPSIMANVSEGSFTAKLKELGKVVKEKFTKAVQMVFGWVAKIGKGSYWCPVDSEGHIQPAINPITAGEAYRSGEIDKSTTFVQLGKAESSAIGFKTSRKDAYNLYGKGNTLDYLRRMVKEGQEPSALPQVLEELGWITAEENAFNKELNEVKLQNEDPLAKYNVLDTPALEARINVALKQNGKVAPLLIYGAPGIGKTAILETVLNTLPDGKDWNLIVKTLSNETPENFTLPKYVEVSGETKADDIPKTWMPVYKPTGDAVKDSELDAACGKGLLFIDELSRASAQVLNVVLPLVNERRFNGYKLGSGWVIICASNRAEDELSGQSNIGNALSNRFSVVYYEPTAKSWAKWAKIQGYISPVLTQWLEMAETEQLGGGKFFYWDPNEKGDMDQETKLMCTPRAWTNAMRELACYAQTGTLEGFTIFDLPREIIAMTLNMYVPADAVDSFLAFLDMIRKIGNFDAIVDAVWRNSGKGINIPKKDLALVSLPLAQLIVANHAKALPTEEEYASLTDWLISTGSDQLTSYVFDIMLEMYAGKVKEDKRKFLFIARGLYDKSPATRQTEIESTFKPMLQAWGITMKELPDYSKSQQKLGAKFKDIFAAAAVDGNDGL